VKTNNLIRCLKSASAIAAVAAGLALTGCNPPSSTDNAQSAYALPALPPTLPLTTGNATPVNDAPRAAALPDVKPITVSRVSNPGDAYAYADDASGFSDALGDAPPDYGFDYEDVEPWAWQGYDDSQVFAEPIDDGYRYYYYRPGADEPYFVRDPDYGYGYADGSLAVVYGPGGAIVPYDDYGPRLTYASRYYARGHNLWQASRQRQRRAVIAANWSARQNAITSSRARWDQNRAQQQAWQAYHDRVARQDADHWREEQARRRADTVRFADWRQQDYRTPPPPRAIPATWTRHKWAQDQSRFAPAAPGFNGDAAHRAQAARIEQQRLAALAQRQRAKAADRARTEQQRQQQARAQQQTRSQQQAAARDRAQHDRQQAAQQQQAAAAKRQHDAAQRQHDVAQQRQAQQQAAAAQRQAATAKQHAAAQQRATAHKQAQQQAAAKQRATAAERASAQTAARAKQQANAQAAKARAKQQADAAAKARTRQQADTAAKARAAQADRAATAAKQRAAAQQASRQQAAAARQHDQAAQQQKAQAARAQAAERSRAQAAQRAQHAPAARPQARPQPQARPKPQRQEPQGGPARQKRPDRN